MASEPVLVINLTRLLFQHASCMWACTHSRLTKIEYNIIIEYNAIIEYNMIIDDIIIENIII